MVYLSRACLRFASVAPIALHGDHRLGDCERIVRRAEAHDVGGARIGLELAMN